MSLFVRYQPVALGSGGGGIASINGDSTPAQLIVAASTGTDFTVVTSGGTTTLAIPSASATARGLITTGTQTIAGAKTFTGAMALSSTLSVAGDFSFTNAGNRTFSIVASGAATIGKNLTIASGNSGAGTDLAGGDLNISTGLGTGADTTPTLNLKLPTTNVSGTSAQSAYTALSLASFDVDVGGDTYPTLTLQSSNQNKSFTFVTQSKGNDSEIQATSLFGDQATDLTISIINQLTSADVPGGNFNIWAGQSTGAAGSSIVLSVSDVSGSGTTLNPLQKGLQVNSAPNSTDGPSVTLGNSGKPNSQHSVYTKTSTGASVATMTNSPVVGNPHGWLKISINGTLSYIPFWQ